MTFDSIEEIRAYVADAYSRQRQSRIPMKLDLAAARPSPLVERAIELGGRDGITDADLRRALTPPIAQKRFENAIWQLESAGLIVRSFERRPDKRGHLRDQIVWRTEALCDPRG